jgi:hypothetical protein
MNKRLIEKQVQKALDHSGAFIVEIEETYSAQWIPLHLEVLLNQCAFGLIYYGIPKDEVLSNLEHEITRIYNALDQERIAQTN